MVYDTIVIGNGKDAIQTALESGRRGDRVALIRQPEERFASVTTELLQSSVDELLQTGTASMDRLRAIVAQRLGQQSMAAQSELDRLGIDVLTGEIEFLNASSVRVAGEIATAPSIVVATGTRSAALRQAQFDTQVILSAEGLLEVDALPESIVVVGAGRVGLDYAILLARLGVNVTVIDEQSSFFQLCGGLMSRTMLQVQSLGIAIRLGDEVIGVEKQAGGRGIVVRLSSGRALAADAALICVGREGRTAGLELESVGVGLDEHGRIWCDHLGRTWAPGIVARGDVVGFRSSLAG